MATYDWMPGRAGHRSRGALGWRSLVGNVLISTRDPAVPATPASTPTNASGAARENTRPSSATLFPSRGDSPFGGTKKELESLQETSANKPGPSPVRVDRLAFWLEGYDESQKHYLVEGFRSGFKVGFVGSPLCQISSNLVFCASATFAH
jgi:hypothetical protein